jgi:hypothetical protein
MRPLTERAERKEMQRNFTFVKVEEGFKPNNQIVNKQTKED